MRWKLIVIFTLILIFIQILCEIPSGFLATKNPQIIKESWFSILSLWIRFIADVLVLTVFLKNKLERPKLCAFIVCLAAFVTNLFSVHLVFGDTVPVSTLSLAPIFVIAAVATASFLSNLPTRRPSNA